jgi:peptidoglycan/xylan/chitin deacetylase (PgdA/CDA1 family)
MTSFPLIVTALALLLDVVPQSAPVAPAVPARVERVPILMYHVIADPPPSAAWPHLWVSPAELAGQLAWLGRQGFTGVTLSDVWRNWHERAPLPERPIVLTFDDGYPSVVREALPLLRARRWPAVLNLKIGNLGPGALSDIQVRRLLASGWELAAHTLTHPDLRTLDDTALEREVAGSRSMLRRRFGVPVDFFCYPSGSYDERVLAAVRRAGFLGATTTEEGLAARTDDPFRLKRVRVSRGDGVRKLATSLPARSGASRGSATPARGSDNRA